MAAFVTDSFTDTNSTAITAHTGELGASWTRHASATNAGAPVISSNQLVTTEADLNENYYASGVPASADYTVSLTTTHTGGDYSQIVGPAARLSTSVNTGYFFIVFRSVSQARLYKYVAGTLTQIGSGVSLVPGSGISYRLTIDVSGTSIKGRIQRLSDSQWLSSAGTFQAGQTDCTTATDSAITAAGRAGFWFAHTAASAVRTLVNDFSADEAGSAATATTLSGPSSGAVGSPSSNFTVGANGTITGTVTITPSDGGGGGSFSPTSVGINTGAPTGTFTYTPASAGAKTISTSNNGGLSNPASISYTATAAVKYTRVDTTDTIGGQNIMVLVPNSNAAIPYIAANPTPVILYAHGSGEDQTALVSDSLKATCLDALLDAGYILAGTNARGNNWGNQSSVDDYAALEKYVRANYNVEGVALWSQSMGGLDGLSVVAQGKIDIKGWLGTYPVCNLANLHGLGTYTSAINTAHGVTGVGNATYANLTYGMDPALKSAEAFRSVPMRFYASSGDTVVPKADNTDVLQAIVSTTRTEAVVVACTGNHGDASHFVPAEYVAFFNRCFAAAARTVTLDLVSAAGAALPSLSGLKWAFFEQDNIGTLSLRPVANGTVESTDGSGALVVSVTTRLAPGGVGWLIVTDSDGTTTQSPAHKAFSGPVAVA